MGAVLPKQKLGPQNSSPIRLVTPWFIECGFYLSLVYGMAGPVLGIQIDRLGIVVLAGLACLCFIGLTERPVEFFKTLGFPISLGIAFILIQYMYHGHSIMSSSPRLFIAWIFTLIVVQALSFRQGFLHRYAIFALSLGIALLPLLDFKDYGTEMTRVALEPGMGLLSNSNGLGEWFGFCTVYFYMFGVISQRSKDRLISWVIATGCLFIVMLTVSRGALIGSLIGIVLASKDFLKQGFFPVMLLTLLAGIAFGTGMFDQTISFYTMRASEGSLRLLIWPRALEVFIDAPLTGVGLSNSQIFVPEKAKSMAVHNGFIYLALTSGILPLTLYGAYWTQAIWAAIKQQAVRTSKSPLLLPLVAYAFFICLLSSTTFMTPAIVVTLAASLTSSIPTRFVAPKVALSAKNQKGPLG